MKKFKVTVQKEIIVEFDENSQDFKDLFEGYKEIIDSDADYESLAESVANQVARYGIDDFIEGVGYVLKKGKKQHVFHEGEYTQQEGYINVITDTDINNVVEFEIYSTEDLSDADVAQHDA